MLHNYIYRRTIAISIERQEIRIGPKAAYIYPGGVSGLVVEYVPATDETRVIPGWLPDVALLYISPDYSIFH